MSGHSDSDRRLTLLLVEDDAPIVELIGMLVAPLGVEVVSCTDGASAIERLEQITPTAILVDLVMPNVGGFSVIEAARRRPELADVPIVVVSAQSDRASVTRAFALGASDFIAKPFHVDLLAARLGSFLHAGRLLDVPLGGGSAAAHDAVDVTALLRSIVERDLLEHPAHGRIALQHEPAVPSARGDERRLRHVLLMLLFDALAAARTGEPVALRLSSIDGRVRIRIGDPDRVEPPEHLAASLDGRSSRGVSGVATGRRVIEWMGGTLEVPSPTGHGAFVIELPVAV